MIEEGGLKILEDGLNVTGDVEVFGKIVSDDWSKKSEFWGGFIAGGSEIWGDLKVFRPTNPKSAKVHIDGDLNVTGVIGGISCQVRGKRPQLR